MPDSADELLGPRTNTPITGIQEDRHRAATVEDIQKLLAPMQKQLDALQAENTQLKEQLQAIPEEDKEKALVGRFRRDVARAVTLATRPVIENPDDYKHVVDAGGLFKNDNPNKGE